MSGMPFSVERTVGLAKEVIANAHFGGGLGCPNLLPLQLQGRSLGEREEMSLGPGKKILEK